MCRKNLGDPDEETREYTDDNSWRDEIAEFVSAVIDDTHIANGSSQDALKTMQLVYRIYCADAEWKARWGLSDEVPATESGKLG